MDLQTYYTKIKKNRQTLTMSTDSDDNLKTDDVKINDDEVLLSTEDNSTSSNSDSISDSKSKTRSNKSFSEVESDIEAGEEDDELDNFFNIEENFESIDNDKIDMEDLKNYEEELNQKPLEVENDHINLETNTDEEYLDIPEEISNRDIVIFFNNKFECLLDKIQELKFKIEDMETGKISSNDKICDLRYERLEAGENFDFICSCLTKNRIASDLQVFEKIYGDICVQLPIRIISKDKGLYWVNNEWHNDTNLDYMTKVIAYNLRTLYHKVLSYSDKKKKSEIDEDMKYINKMKEEKYHKMLKNGLLKQYRDSIGNKVIYRS